MQRFFNVGSLQSINVLDSSGKPRSVSDLVNHKAEIALFTFRFTVTASDIDQRFPSTTLSLEFSLRLPQIFFPNCSAPAQDVSTITAQNTHTNTNDVAMCSICGVYLETTIGSSDITVLMIACQLSRAQSYRKIDHHHFCWLVDPLSYYFLYQFITQR